MEQISNEIPSSELGESKENPITPPVNKPWGIYLVAVWCFFGIGGFTNPLFKSLISSAQDSPQLVPVIGLLYIGGLLGLIVGTLKLNRFWLVLCALLMGLIGVFQLLSIVTFVLVGQVTIPMLVIKIFYAVPSCACAWYCARPSFLNMASNYTVYKKQVAMQKHVQKQLMRGNV